MDLPAAAPFPGFVPGRSVAGSPALVDVFRPADAGLRWRLDFHYPRGIVPLGHELLALLNRASQEAARSLPVPTGRGLVSRLVGPHVYTAGLAVEDVAERADRAAASSVQIASYPDRFPTEWRTQADGLGDGYTALVGRLRSVDDLRDLGRLFDDASAYAASAWRTHFDVMYRLLAVLESFRTVCSAVGVPAQQASRLLPASGTVVARTDAELWALSRAAGDAGLAPVFREHSGDALLRRLADDPAARPWLTDFQAFLALRGSRGESVSDLRTPSWAEAPERPLALVRQLLLGGKDPAASAALEAARREQRLAQLRAGLSPRHRATFDRSYAWCLRANFAWWNEEHNPHIDLRVHLPYRAAGRAVVLSSGGEPDDALMLYAGEVRALVAGEVGWSDLVDVVQERWAHDAAWQQRRDSLPRGVGRQDGPADPLMVEIIGVDHDIGISTPTLLRGLAVSPGNVRGTVRRVTDVTQLDRVRTGEVMVCEATSPSWTSVFPRLAACLCDSGGVLTHAAIISREYGVPCVCALGVAMQVLRDGDLVEVDGSAGTVTVLRTP